jgi:hypothetical protein
MKYFLDTEFNECRGSIELISIGIACEDGRAYYAESCQFKADYCNQYVKENILPKLGPVQDRLPLVVIAEEIQDFIAAPHDLVRGKARPEFWAYYASYDWVVFCWLFGVMVDLPDGYPYHPMDLQQWWLQLGSPDIKPPDPENEHHAMADALWNQQLWHKLIAEQNERYAR